MSRIGLSLITIPAGVTLSIDGSVVKCKGPKGELTQAIDPDLTLTIEDGSASLARPTDQKRHKSMHGLYRSLIDNMVVGVSDGYTKELELIGVGYRVASTGNLIEFTLGYSHPIYFYVPDEIKVETAMEKGSPPNIKLSGIDKQLIGQIAAKIRTFRKIEPYKGKGVRFKGEEIRRKAGKTAT